MRTIEGGGLVAAIEAMGQKLTWATIYLLAKFNHACIVLVLFCMNNLSVFDGLIYILLHAVDLLISHPNSDSC